MKTTLLALLATLMLVSVPTSARDVSSREIAEVESKFMRGCLENEENDQEHCTCAINGMKEKVAEKDYYLMMGIVAHAIEGEVFGIFDFIVDNGMTLSKLDAFGKRIERTMDELEEECGNININLTFGDDEIET